VLATAKPAKARRRQRNNCSGYAKFYSRAHDAVIRVYDEAGNVIETHENAGISKSRSGHGLVIWSKTKAATR